MIKCKEATQLLSEKMDRPLNVKEKVLLTLHTSICSPCRQFGEQMKTMREISKSYTKESDTTKK
ncbi:zf-HC2 domain-containing protein [Marinomonas sp. BSi20584]|jgi:predicted anti-sigma-YlaC factor YlaD|uniref:zf-HC2 domain-containing protein n=1 Tax=Marinomonas sp. BSi20584 TaxID=1594462 RepID=UPI000C1F517E|nr:zf-HC2 domain-containing protein [Marinomonas sp. BSi20584]PJE56597.1 hypothetical protein TY87_04780 [Marinomonas sp. BSi20584]